MRSKLTHDLDQLQVDSFDTSADEQAQRGTVHGNADCTCQCCETDFTACGQNSCAASCNGTCVASCNGTCNEYTCINCYGSDYCTNGPNATCYGYGSCGAPRTECYDIP